jgi:large repetitive protein
MHRTSILLLTLAWWAIPGPVWAQTTSATANLSINVMQSQAITGVSLSNSNFQGGAASGTVVGTISVTMSPAAPAFSGTLSLGGANAASFQIVGSNLETNGTVPAGSYQLSIVAVENGVTGSPFTQAETVTGTSPAASTCLQGTAYVSAGDGCQGAQASGSVQHLNFFTGYTGSTYPVRPPWNVAGVDYPVGYSTSITLATPTQTALQASCPGASYSGNTLTISGSSDCTINGFDFSKVSNCAAVTISNSATVTLSNNNFDTSGCTVYGVTISFTGNGTYNILYNQFTGSGYPVNNGGPGGFMQSNSGLSYTANINYNAFLATDQSVMSGNSGTNNMHYNYAENLGCCGNHADFNISTQTSGTVTWGMSFNTIYGHYATATTECYVSTGGVGGTITGYCNNQTMIANPGGPVTVSYMIESSDGTIGNWSANNNYLDINGSYGYYATMTTGQTVVGAITCTGNMDLSTGAQATGTFTGATCN